MESQQERVSNPMGEDPKELRRTFKNKKALRIPLDLPNRHWGEMSRKEAENYVISQIGWIFVMLLMIVFGGFIGFVMSSSNNWKSNSIPVKVVSNYYSITGQMPSQMFVTWYNDQYDFSRPILSVDQIKTEINLINKANQPITDDK